MQCKVYDMLSRVGKWMSYLEKNRMSDYDHNIPLDRMTFAGMDRKYAKLTGTNVIFAIRPAWVWIGAPILKRFLGTFSGNVSTHLFRDGKGVWACVNPAVTVRSRLRVERYGGGEARLHAMGEGDGRRLHGPASPDHESRKTNSRKDLETHGKSHEIMSIRQNETKEQSAFYFGYFTRNIPPPPADLVEVRRRG